MESVDALKALAVNYTSTAWAEAERYVTSIDLEAWWEMMPPVVKDYALRIWKDAVGHPVHVTIEVFFACIIIYFLFLQPTRRAKSFRTERPTPQEQAEMLEEYSSKPFETNFTAHSNANDAVPVSIQAYSGPYAEVMLPGNRNAKPRKMLNFASFDALSYSTDPRVIEAAKKTVRAYGVGSCGPRGFYGSMQPHITLEEDLARFLGVHSAIIYSFQFATTSTLIPCFSAKQDTILCDNAVNIVIQKGCTLSRSHVSHFRHNDMAHLEELMKQTIENDRRKHRKLFRRFVVTEGIFKNSGDMCPLPQLVDLCDKYKFRLVLDDSYAFGLVGATGRGTPEHFNIPQERISIYIGSLSTALGAVGGFCAGTNMVVDHQRLAATGYVFSAALPPYVTVAASTVIGILEKDSSRVSKLTSNSQKARKYFSQSGSLPRGLMLVGCFNDVSPILHIMSAKNYVDRNLDPEEDQKFDAVVKKLASEHDILATRALYNDEEVLPFPASLRLVIRSEINDSELNTALKAVSAALKQVF